jgi:Uma2 family endonuclease
MVRPARNRRDELYEEYQGLPQHEHAEIINGTLYVVPRPSPRHASAASALNRRIGTPFQDGNGGPGGWWILVEAELQLVEKEPVIPDVAGWRVERMPELPETAYFAVVPHWVCEVLSKSTERIDRDEKLPYYAKHGVRHVWLVDPIDKRLEVYTLDDETERWREVRTYRADNGAIRAAPFDAVELDLAALWSAPKR